MTLNKEQKEEFKKAQAADTYKHLKRRLEAVGIVTLYDVGNDRFRCMSINNAEVFIRTLNELRFFTEGCEFMSKCMDFDTHDDI